MLLIRNDFNHWLKSNIGEKKENRMTLKQTTFLSMPAAMKVNSFPRQKSEQCATVCWEAWHLFGHVLSNEYEGADSYSSFPHKHIQTHVFPHLDKLIVVFSGLELDLSLVIGYHGGNVALLNCFSLLVTVHFRQATAWWTCAHFSRDKVTRKDSILRKNCAEVWCVFTWQTN